MSAWRAHLFSVELFAKPEGNKGVDSDEQAGTEAPGEADAGSVSLAKALQAVSQQVVALLWRTCEIAKGSV